MAPEERTQEILKGLQQAVIEFDEDKTRESAQAAIDEGVDPFVATLEGLAEGMILVGDLYNKRSTLSRNYFCAPMPFMRDWNYSNRRLWLPEELVKPKAPLCWEWWKAMSTTSVKI